MKQITYLIAALILLITLVDIAGAQEQTILFCAQSTRSRSEVPSTAGVAYAAGECRKDCAEHSEERCKLKEHLREGWQIVTTTPREIPKEIPVGTCACVGTQYVLKKVEKSAAPTDEVRLLKKEVELLQKENEMIKKQLEQSKTEVEQMKNELEQRKKATKR